MKRFAVLLSPQGYEMSVAIANDKEKALTAAGDLSEESVRKYAIIMLTWEFEREINIDNSYYNNDETMIRRRMEEYKRKRIEYGAKETGGEINIGNQMAYYIRKNHAFVEGQKEFIFALNQDDMDWIYQRDPITAGLILCQLFDGTKSGEFVKKEIEDHRTGKKRFIVGYNKMAPEQWDENLEYDLEDFHDQYKAKFRSMQRREKRGK